MSSTTDEEQNVPQEEKSDVRDTSPPTPPVKPPADDGEMDEKKRRKSQIDQVFARISQYGKQLSEMFTRVGETMVLEVAPTDDTVQRMSETCALLDSITQTSLEYLINLMQDATWLNRNLRMYRHRKRLYSYEERCLLNNANAIMTLWRADLSELLRSHQAQIKQQ